MSIGWIILMIVVSLAFIINNAAREFVRRDNERREWEEMVNRQEAERLNREAAQINHNLATMRQAMADIDKTIISDAIVISETKYIS